MDHRRQGLGQLRRDVDAVELAAVETVAVDRDEHLRFDLAEPVHDALEPEVR